MGQAAEELEQTEVTEPTEPKKRTPRAPAINMARFAEAGYARNVFVVTAVEGTTIEQICDQAYWQHVAHMLKPADRIEVLDETMSYFIELIVLAQDRLWAHVGILQHIDLRPFHGQDIPIAEVDYEVKYAGTHVKWRVLYKGDKLKDGFATEGLARRWVSNHIASRSRSVPSKED